MEILGSTSQAAENSTEKIVCDSKTCQPSIRPVEEIGKHNLEYKC